MDSGRSPRSFHPSKEGFKVRYLHRRTDLLVYVSIPLRKVSRGIFPPGEYPSEAVSIPLRKVSRLFHLQRDARPHSGFHPSKEGFKALPGVMSSRRVSPFPSL